MPTTYTVAQALATNAIGILVADSASNIANNVSNPGLVSRVSLFSLNGNGAVTAQQAAALAAIGSKFSMASFRLTERDTVAHIIADGATVSGITVAVQDTAANILAAANTPIIRNANSIALTANATLTLAQLLTLESWPSFTAPALTLTLADSAANLLAFTPAEAKGSLTVFQVNANSTVTAAQAVTLAALSNFGLVSGVTLTIADNVGNIVAATPSLHNLLTSSGVTVNFSDTMADLLAQASLNWSLYPNATIALSVSSTATVSQAAILATLPNFSVAAGQSLTIADTVNHLVTLTGGQTALATTISLSGNDTATAAQLVALAALPHFSAGFTLTVDDTLAHLATLTPTQRAVATAETIDDTVSDLLAPQPSAFTGATGIVAELDGTTLDAAQATALAALAAHATLTLHPNGSNTTLTISDTLQNLIAAGTGIETLESDGPVTVTATTGANGAILSASAAAALILAGTNPANGTYAVADTGSALSAVASQIFGQGFEAITVTSGSFAGTMAQLLDPTLHFSAGSSAQLSTNATASVAQALGLEVLPGFSRANGVTVTVLDSITNILAAAAALPAIASSILANDTETVSAAGAATLAALTGFSLHDNSLTLADTAANLVAATPGAITLATAVHLTSDALISEAMALQFVAMGVKFSPHGFFVAVYDTIANLEALTAPGTLSVVNSWISSAVLSTNGTGSVADATALSHLVGFNVGTRELTISDSAANLLAADNGVLALAHVVQLSQASTVTAANAVTLEALQGFSANGLLTIVDTPAALAAMGASLATPASSVSLATEIDANASAYAINATQFAAMLALPHFSLAGFTGTVSVTDTAASLTALAASLNSLSPSVLSHIMTTLSAPATVTVATAEALHALPDFSRGEFSLTISDTAANIATLDPGTAALASSIVTSGGAFSLSVATFDSVVGVAGFSDLPGSLTVSDTAAQLLTLVGSSNLPYLSSIVLNAPATLSVANAEQLSTLPNLLLGNNLTIADTAANLLHITGTGPTPDDWAIEQQATSVVLTANALSLSAAQATLLAQLGNRFSAGGFTLTVQDTATALLGLNGELNPIAGQITSITLASGGSPINLAQAQQLDLLPSFTAGSVSVAIADTVANLAAAVNGSAIISILAHMPDATFTLAGNDTASVAQTQALNTLGNAFSRGSSTLTIIDGAGHLATLNPGEAALASAIELQGSTLTSVANFEAIRALPNYSNNGNLLVVSDTAAHLLGLVDSNVSLASEIMLSTSATNLSAFQAEQLATLGNFTTGIAHLTILDSAADLLQVTGEGPLPDDWAGELVASGVTLNGNATVTAAQAAELAVLGSRFSVGPNTLTVSDSAANLVSSADAGGLALAGAVTLSGDETALSAATATLLAQLGHFNKGGHHVTISDTAANLAFAGNAAGLALADHVQLSQASSMTVAAAEALIGMANFQVNTGAPITITDTLPDLLGLATAELPFNNTVLAATSIALSQNTIATAAQIEALTALPQYASFSLDSHTLTLADSGENLAALTPEEAAAAGSVVMIGDALLTAAQADALAALSINLGGYSLTVSDTATALLSPSNIDGLAIASAIVLSGAATVDAADAARLFAKVAFSTGGQPLTISDTAAALLALASPISHAATTLDLSESGDVVTVAQLAQLAALGGKFSLNDHTLTVSDTLANLLTLNSIETALVSSEVATDTGTSILTAAKATALAASDLTVPNGLTIIVQDTAANLAFTGYAAGLALANGVQLSAPASLTVAAAEMLIGMANFQVNGAAPIIIDDTFLNLLTLPGAGLAHNSSVLAATPIELSANAVVTVAQMQALAALPQYASFSLNDHTITVEDSGRNLASFAPDAIAVPSAYVMIGDATLTAAQAGVLAAEHATLDGNNLTVSDTPAALLSLSESVTALATGLTLSGPATVTAVQATELEALAVGHIFSTGGFALTVTGSASALLGLSTPTQQMAAALVLSESGDTISVANLLQLTELGSKFSLNDNTLTVSDAAAQLATLNNLETALVNTAVLDQTATIDTITATELAALPGFVLGNGVALTVQGTYAELAALPTTITSIATLELTGSAQNLTASQAATLAALPNFSPSSGVVVQDTIANLNAPANAGWPTAATGGYIVTDSVSNLLDNATSLLLAHANSVTLLGDAQVDAADFTTLSDMLNFSRGTASLIVEDGSVAIANVATKIALLATSALVDSSAPVSAAQAEALATLNTAHMLSFTGGNFVSEQDSFDNITSGTNAAGLALASTVTVVGTAAELIAATAYGWGAVQPYYELNADADITGAQATTLHALGNHFLPNDNLLTVIDNAANVVSNAAAIVALGIVAQVDDSAANVADVAGALAVLGNTLQSITLTDIAPVLAASAAGLAPVASKLTGPPIAVSDTALQVAANLAGLDAIETHLASVAVIDIAANVGAVASDLASLGADTTLTITLTDATTDTPVTASVAALLVPVDAYLADASVNVADTGAAIAADAATLAQLHAVLGTITLSDGTTVDAAVAAALAPIGMHLGTGVTLSVTDTAAAIAAAADGLSELQTNGEISSITAANETVADVLTYAGTLASLRATATISDSAAHVSAHLDALEPLAGASLVTAIALTDGGTPDITLTLQQITPDRDVLDLISGSFKYAIVDSSANIAADLTNFVTSHILQLGPQVDSITVTDENDTLTLNAQALLTPFVDIGAGSALTKLVHGTQLAVIGMPVAEFANLGLLAVTPNSYAVVDAASAIQADLNDNLVTSALLNNLDAITSITTGGAITLDYATASAPHVNDGAGSVFAKMSGEALVVTGVPVADIASILATGVAPASITVVDTASQIAADLGSATPALVQFGANISSITVSPAGAITLDADHALAAGVDDGSSSVFAKMTGDTLAVTGATVAQLDALHGLFHVPDSVAVSDVASTIAGDLALGADSRLETYAADGMVTAVGVNDGPVVLDDIFITPAIGDALELLPPASLQVTNVPIADIATVSGLAAFLSMTVTDSAADIEADLILDGSSELAQHAGVITGITVTGAPMSLTDAQVLAADSSALALLPGGVLQVTGVAVADIAAIAAIGAPIAGMAVIDSVADIASDLNGLPSEIILNGSKIITISVTDASPVLASAAAELAPVASKLTGPQIAVSDSALQVAAYLSGLQQLGPHLSSVTVTDTAANVGANAVILNMLGFETTLHITLTDATLETPVSAGVAVELLPVSTHLAIASVDVSDTGAHLAADATPLAALGPVLGTITLIDGTATDAAVAAALAPIDGHLGTGVMLSVTDTAAAIAAAAVQLANLKTDDRISSITAPNETVADVQTYGAALSTLGATTTISDSAANVSAHLDALEPLANSVMTAITLTDGGTPDIALALQQLTTDAGVLNLISGSFRYAIVDSSAHIAADLGGGASQILALVLRIDTIAVTDEGNTLTLSAATLLAPLVDSGPVAALSRLVDGTQLAVTGMTVADFGSLGLLAVRPDSYAVADTASDIQADLNDNTGASVLLANLSVITSIVTSGSITLDYATATAISVNNGGGSVFSKMSGESLVVTGVPVAGLASLFTTGVAPTSITVVDVPAHVAIDLQTASPVLVQYIASISSISVIPSGAVVLDADHALASGVDDGPASVFAKMTGDSLAVINASVAQLNALHALFHVPDSVAVSDTAANIAADLALGAESLLETYVADNMVTAMSVSSGEVTLDDIYLVPAIAEALALVPNFQITNVPIGNIADVAALGTLTSMTVSDTAAHLEADLILGASSELAQHFLLITGVTVTGGPIILTEAQVTDVNSTAIFLLPPGSVDVTGVTVSEIPGTVAALGLALANMTINDSAANVATDLQLGAGTSELELNAAKIGSISVTAGPVALSDTAAWAVTTALAKLSAGSLTISAAPVAHVGTYGALTGLLSMTVADTAAAVQGDLTSDTSVLQTYAHTDRIVSIIVNDAPVLLTDSQAEAVLSALSVLGGTGGLAVSNVSVADILTIGTLPAISGITVSDSAANIHNDLINNTVSAIYEFRNVITNVSAADVPVSIGFTELAEIQSAALALLAPGNLVVTDVPVADVAAVAALSALNHMTVSDTAPNLQNDLLLDGSSVLQTNHAKIGGIVVTSGHVTLADSDASTVMNALELFTGANTLVVTGVLVADVVAIGALAALDHMTVSDTAALVQSDLTNGTLSVLEQNAGDISGISFTSGSAVTLTGAQAVSVMDALAVLPADSLTVTSAAEAQVAALAALAALASMTVSDTALNIQADLALGATSPIEENIAKITGIAFAGSIELNYTAAKDVLPALAKLPSDSPLTVNDVPVANIHDIVVLGPVLASLTVRDTGAAVTTDLALGAGSLIKTYAGSITGISLTSGSVTLTDGQADLVASVLVLLPNGHLTVTGVPVGSDITTFNLLGPVLSGMTVSDTAANIQSDLTSISGSLIETAIGKISNINVTSGGPIALTDTQANAVLAALTVLPAGSLTISAVPVGDIAAFAGLSAVLTMAVRDTGSTIASDLAQLAQSGSSVIETNLAKISGITLSSGSVTLTDAQADAAFAALAKLPADSLTVTGVPLSDVAHIASLGGVLAGMTVLDTASDVQTDLTSGTVLATNASAITSISLSGGGQVTLTDTQADGLTAVLGKLPANSLIVTGVPTADVGNIAALSAIFDMTVSDVGTTIQADLALGGSSAILLNISKIVSVTASDVSIAAAVAAAIEAALGPKFADSALVISDTATNILNAFVGSGSAVLAAAATVELSVNAVGLTAAQATTLAGILHGASLGRTVNVADTAANLLSSANAVGIALATTVGVTDTAANMLALAPALIAMEPKLTSATITDGGPLSASAVSDLLALPNLSAGSLTIADNGSQIAAAIEANGPTGVTFLKAHSVQLSVNSVIGASDAAALEQLGTGGLLKEGFTLNVSDTATHLTDAIDGYLAAVSDTTLIDGVYLKTNGGTVTVTAATAAALTTIPNFHKNPVGGGTNILIVQDTATHYDTSYATLVTDLALFNHLYLSTSATVTDAVYGELLGLGVHPVNGGVTVTVRDTAINIASNATAQLGGSPGITPIAWLLSANATVTESQAAVLGGLNGFSAGIFALTLSADAPSVSVASANALGVLGSAFHLGGFTVDVTGPVATLTGLTTAALEVVTPQISDIFSNIAQMSPTSPLLAGTMTVTDAEAITVAQATSFFSLVQVGGSGPGIPAANITFIGGAETITDTLADVRELLALSSWTGNASLRSDFRLEVADTVATLINSANTSLLSAVHGTTLSGDQTATAADLETLFSLENTIHFSPGSYHLTLQDTPANLLNPTYSDAVGLATSLTLPGPETVGAAGAESLMATGKLVLTDSTILTISDTSSDLLDGVLGGAITGGDFTSFVHVTLSDNETLDANTAEALVSLPGYTAGSNTLSIVDGVSYLLNPANHLAEVDATSVTLDGDATVSAATAVSLAALPNFALDGNTLFLASNDYADAATLTTLAGLGSGCTRHGNTLSLTQNASVNATQLAEVGDFGSGLQAAGHTLTLTQDALALTPAEYTAVQSDNVVLNGHAMSAIPTGVSVSEVDNDVQFTGTGVNGATVTLYSASGSEITTTTASPAFTVSALEAGPGINVVATETVNGTESAPIIALEQTILTNAAATDSATFATSGQVQVGTNEYMNVYTAGSQPTNPTNPILVYDPAAHTLSFEAAGHSDIVLVTLGTATHPASLDPSEIFVKHYQPVG